MEREKGLAIGAPEVFLKVYAGKSELCRVPGFVFREECGTMKEMRKDACQAGQNAEKQKQGGNNQTMEPKILFEDKDIWYVRNRQECRCRRLALDGRVW